MHNALESWLAFIVDESPLTQAVVVNQVPAEDRADLSRMVLRRLGERNRNGEGAGMTFWFGLLAGAIGAFAGVSFYRVLRRRPR